MSNLVIDELCKNIKEIYKKKTPVWTDDSLTERDKQILYKEAYEVSPFDKLNLKKIVYDKYVNKEAKVIVKKTENARVVILAEDDSKFPWNTWGRLFQWFDTPKNSSMWVVYLYASKEKRVLPDIGQASAEHLNGGYTYPCKSDSIIIYRYEEATRVLIHELLHAACTDDFSKPVELREASTEVWAELFLVALLSKGDINLAKRLWKIQDHHIQDLNYTVYNYHNTKTIEDYGSRYTILRNGVLDSLRIFLDKKYKPVRIKSSRFTSVKLDKYLE